MRPSKYLIFFSLLMLFACGERSANDNAMADRSREAELLDAIHKYPDSALLKENLMQYYRDSGYYDKALKIVNDLVAHDSLNAHWYDIKGILSLEKGDTAASIKSYEKTLALDPMPEYVIALGTLYAQTKNPKALEMADALIGANKAKADRQALFIKGLYYSYSGQKQKAISYFDQCLQMSYTDMDSYIEKSIAQYDLTDYSGALKTLNRALTVDNSFDEAYFYRGKVLEKMGRKPEAIESYQQALMFDKDYLEAKEALAKLGVPVK